jgi:ABC-type amino acid transport substrate-binding protein
LPGGATTAARVRARGFLRVGVRYDLEPFGYVTDEGDLAGFDVDLSRDLARRWLGDEDAVQFKQVRSDTAIEHLQAGHVDLVAAALLHTQPGEAGADFSQPYFVDGQALLVRANDAAPIGALADLQGRPVGVTVYGEARDTIEGAVPFTLTLQTYNRFDGAVAALGQGEVDAVADLRRRLFWGQRMLPQVETAIVGQYSSAPVAIAFPQDEPFFADLVRLTFQGMAADGTYAELYGRWFGSDSPLAVEAWPGSATISLAEAPVTADTPDTIELIQSRGHAVVAMAPDRQPFAYLDAEGNPAGYEIQLVRRLVERWLGDPMLVEFVPVDVEEGEALLHSGQADLLIGGLVHTREAERRLDFSLSSYLGGESLLVPAESTVAEVTDLAGQQVAVVEKSESREALLAAAQSGGVSLTVMPQPSLEAAIAVLEGGQVAAVAGGRIALLGVSHARADLTVLPARLTQAPLAIGLPPGDSAFRDLVNMTLQAMRVAGDFEAVYGAWFSDDPPDWYAWPGAPYRSLQLELAESAQ